MSQQTQSQVQANLKNQVEHVIQQYKTLFSSTLQQLGNINLTGKTSEKDKDRLAIIDNSIQQSQQQQKRIHPDIFSKKGLFGLGESKKNPIFNDYLSQLYKLRKEFKTLLPFLPNDLVGQAFLFMRQQQKSSQVIINTLYNMDERISGIIRLLNTATKTTMTFKTKLQLVLNMDPTQYQQIINTYNRKLQLKASQQLFFQVSSELELLKFLSRHRSSIQELMTTFTTSNTIKKYLQMMFIADENMEKIK